MVLCFRVIMFLVSLYMLWYIKVEAQPLAHICPNTTTFSPNSTYQTNLNTLLATLSSDNTRNAMFYNTTAGNIAPDMAYGLYMCRGDVTLNDCHDCVVNATEEIIERCPREKVAYIWYDECMLRYANESFFSKLLVEMPVVYMYNTRSVTFDGDNTTLMQFLTNATNNLASRASNETSGNGGGQMKGFATGESYLLGFIKLYFLVQCTPDLSGSDCNRCLSVATGLLPACCNGSLGGRVFLPSCNIRYEAYQFYNNISTSALPPSPPLPPEGDDGLSVGAIIGIVVSVIFSLLLFIFFFRFLRRRRRPHKHNLILDGDEILEVESLQYNLSTIEAATNNFSTENKVGEGGFGDVFKGTLSNGQDIAVKRLSKRSGQGAQEFKNEVALIAKLQHKNLVRLVGFCLEREENILIYEFVPNKSLDYFLFDQEKKQLLDWSRRYKIIEGIAQGILYLHDHSRLRIIHRDLKASNILLDGDMNPKISDFGLARIFGVDQYQGNTNRIVGTFGYMAPEYVAHGEFSTKSDVFSFGVIILEIISGEKNHSFYQPGGSKNLPSCAWKLWMDRTPLDLVDPTLADSIVKDEVIRCINIGLLCVQAYADQRPSMASLLRMLTSDSSSSLPLPHQPAFLVHRTTDIVPQSNSNSMPWSASGVSTSESWPR